MRYSVLDNEDLMTYVMRPLSPLIIIIIMLMHPFSAISERSHIMHLSISASSYTSH